MEKIIGDKKKNKNLSISESELLRILLSDIFPFIESKKEKKQDKLEKIVSESDSESKLTKKSRTSDIELKDFMEIEALLLEKLGLKNKKSVQLTNTDINNNENQLSYISEITRRKEKDELEQFSGYDIVIKYENNNNEEKLDITIIPHNYSLPEQNNNEKNSPSLKVNFFPDYKISIISKKPNPSDDNYSVKLTYENTYNEERLLMSYKYRRASYLQKHINSKEDFTERVPLKWLNIFPETLMGGVLGFTYLGENFMGRRADLTGQKARMVDIHESIHTPDEYETRILTDWIMSRERPRYLK